MRTHARRALFMVLASAAVSGCRRGEEDKPKAPTPVRVKVVAGATAKGASRYSGTVEPEAKVDLAFKVGGYVREVAGAKGQRRKLQEGDWVTKGTILAVINEADYRQKVSAARASLAEANASEKQSQLDFERAKTLFDSNAITKADYDGAVAKRDVAIARAAAGRANVTQADIALTDCTLRAPFDGVVIRRNIEVGTLASPGTLAYTIADTRTAKVIFGAPDTMLDRLRIGEKLTVRLESLGKDLIADITRISPSADAKSRTFDVEASLPNKGDQIKVGMIASIQMPETAQAASALALPLTAVVRAPKDPRGFAVFVVDGAADSELAQIREVKLGDVVGSAVLVTAGLSPGERVIETGTTLVTDGERVRVVR